MHVREMLGDLRLKMQATLCSSAATVSKHQLLMSSSLIFPLTSQSQVAEFNLDHLFLQRAAVTIVSEGLCRNPEPDPPSKAKKTWLLTERDSEGGPVTYVGDPPAEGEINLN